MPDTLDFILLKTIQFKQNEMTCMDYAVQPDLLLCLQAKINF